MISPNKVPAQPTTGTRDTPVSNPVALRWLALAAIALIVCFSGPLYHLVGFALKNDLYSHILLVPFVSLYLIWIKRPELPQPSAPNRLIAGIFLALGIIVLAVSWGASPSGMGMAEDDYLAPRILSFLFFLIGTAAWMLGRATLRTVAFPLAFLIFMVPFPTVVRSGLETFLQHGSAEAANVLFKLGGTAVFYRDLLFSLPGINLEVAPECSGIRSTLALFITSVIAGHIFLRTPWKCAVLTLAVIPLAIVRNGFRIFTIGELCVRISPDMINSYIHRKGGPIFFVLSLIPFYFLLRLLAKSEPSRQEPMSTPPAP
jgi:exosortase C (VPDSG-CTERM-specific)